jgi:hypothetical protein
VTDGEDVVPFEALTDVDLVVDQLYDGGNAGSVADDPLSRMLPVGNQGGFRYAGSPRKRTVRLAVLYTTGAEPDWPDVLDPQIGMFTYYGDNRRPGHDLHDTRRSGNVLLRDCFDWSHESAETRRSVPPFLLFEKVRETFRDREHDFERCAVELWRLIAPATGRCDVTQPSRDGGRDAVGEYVVGPASDPIAIDFALEAKCYVDTNAVGVRDVARLISRLRHRHFGVFVTTSYFHQQVYSEVRSDGHPIALVSGRDIVDALRSAGHSDLPSVRAWLRQFAAPSPPTP